MSWKEAAEPVLTRMPVVARPEGHVPFKRKLMWTAGVLGLYFFLTNITLLGMAQQGEDLFGQFRAILAGQQGSVLQVGIGPIVTASIVLQLLGGANLLGLDTDDPRDQILYQGLQKLLVVIVTILTAIPMVYAGFISASPQVASQLGISLAGVRLLLMAQIVTGGLLILYLDEIVSKWGVGSGVGLFIIAGVSQRLVGGFLSLEDGFFVTWAKIIIGDIAVGPIPGVGLETIIVGEG